MEVASNKFAKFTERARTVLTASEEEANRFNHLNVHPEHLLLALISMPDNTASLALSHLGVQLPTVRTTVEYFLAHRRWSEAQPGKEGTITKETKKVIELAVDEARLLNHNYVGTEHLLLGLLRQDMSIAGGVFQASALTLETARSAVSQIIEDPDQLSQEAATFRQSSATQGDRKSAGPHLDADAATPEAERIEIAVRALADQPSDVDLLGFNDYATALVDFITNEHTEKPLTISIDAPWGMGKSTLMKLIQSQLIKRAEGPAPSQRKLRRFPRLRAKEITLSASSRTVWFNAWKYDQEESLWAALALAILEELSRSLSPRRRLVLWWQLHRRPLDADLLLTGYVRLIKAVVFAVFVFFAIILLVFLLTPAQNDLTGFRSILINNQQVAGIAAALVVFGTIALDLYRHISNGFERAVGRYVRNPDYAERVGFLNTFETDFAKIVETATHGGRHPLVVFIDDLDRCDPVKTVEVVEAINLLLDAPHCVFIIGMDARTVAASIEAKYKDLRDLHLVDDPGGLNLGYRFLEKIVQITFRIPRANLESIQQFVGRSLSPLDAEAAALQLNEEDVQRLASLIEQNQLPGGAIQASWSAVRDTVPEADMELLEAAKQEVIARQFDQIPSVRTAIQHAAPYLGLNPRKIKRFINSFRLQTLIANRRGQLVDERRISLVARAVLIATRWPETVESLIADPAFCKNLVEVARFKRILASEGHTLPTEERSLLLDAVEGFMANPRNSRLFMASDLLTLLEDLSPDDISALPHFLLMTEITPRLDEEPVRIDTLPKPDAA